MSAPAALPRPPAHHLDPETEAPPPLVFPQTLPQPGARPRRPRIPVVDDEPSMQDLVRDILADAGYALERVADGRAAVTRVRDAPPDKRSDLILMDRQRPVPTGRAAIRGRTGDPATAGIPIIAISASERLASAATLIYQADAVLPKPFDIEARTTAVVFFLAKHAPPPPAAEDVLVAIDHRPSPAATPAPKRRR